MSELLKLTGLWAKTAKNGNRYMVGRLGAARVLLLKNGDKAGDDDPDWLLMAAPVDGKGGKGRRRGGGGGGRERRHQAAVDAQAPVGYGNAGADQDKLL